jgi:NADPH:quinone reductase-like Zn-dependent oxidoreductase
VLTEYARLDESALVRIPIVARVSAFEDAPDAYRYYESARPFGKVVISVG